MDKKTIKSYIERLKNIEEELNDNDFNENTFSEVNEIMNSLKNIVNTDSDVDFSLKILIKKLHNTATIPSYAKEGDAGLDLTATRIIEETNEKIKYGTDLSIEIPKGYVGLLFPRSSVMKYQLSLSNCVGVIDSGYRGEIMAVFNKLNGEFSEKYSIGERICQLIIIPFPLVKLVETDNLSESIRGTGGFGSSEK